LAIDSSAGLNLPIVTAIQSLIVRVKAQSGGDVNPMPSIPQFNILHQLILHGCGLRRVGLHDWQARCPACRSEGYTLSSTFLKMIKCSSPSNCNAGHILGALGMGVAALEAPTPDSVVRALKAVPITDPDEPADRLLAVAGADRDDRAEPGIATTSEPPVAKDGDDSPPRTEESTSTLAAADWQPASDTMEDAYSGQPGAHPPGVPHEGPPPAVPSADTGTDARTGADLLMHIARRMRTIRAADGRHYAAVSCDGRLEYYRLESDEFRRLLFRLFHEQTGSVPRPMVIANILATLRGRAELTTDVEPVYLRVARDPAEGAFLVDLGDPSRTAVRITDGGWELIGRPAIPFWRPPGQRPFPMPVRGGSIELLKKYVNVKEQQWPLLIGWLTAALRPVGPYPLLILTGQQGSAKSTLAQVCRRLLDPHASLLRALPKSERDLMVSAHNNWLLAYDNISGLANWQSDAFCRLSTGGGFTARSLFSDDRETVLNAERPVILNGIDDFVTRGDLVDRGIFLSLPRISPATRRSNQAFWSNFDRDYPALFGALLDAVAVGLRLWPRVELNALSRMADLDCWGEAVTRGLGLLPGTFIAAYYANRRSASLEALDQTPIAAAIVAMLKERPVLEGTPTALLHALTTARPRSAFAATGWPRSPWALSKLLRRLAPQLRELGIIVVFQRKMDARIITIGRDQAASQNKPA
jgi:hypothetical protein